MDGFGIPAITVPGKKCRKPSGITVGGRIETNRAPRKAQFRGSLWTPTPLAGRRPRLTARWHCPFDVQNRMREHPPPPTSHYLMPLQSAVLSRKIARTVTMHVTTLLCPPPVVVGGGENLNFLCRPKTHNRIVFAGGRRKRSKYVWTVT